MDKGWKSCSAQAAELQILRADKDNRKTQGPGFFKMIEDAISTVQEDIARDLYDMAASRREEITRLMQEFDKHDIDTSVQLDDYEQTRQRQTPEIGASASPQPPPRTLILSLASCFLDFGLDLSPFLSFHGSSPLCT